jgi:hypothetical protein
MANEFIARKGLIVPTGSIWVMDGAVTASNFLGTASQAVSSSYALTASYVDSGAGFPFTGNAVITGSLNVTQAVTASFFKGDGSQITNLPSSTGQAALRVDGYTFEADGTTISYTVSESIYSVDDLIISVGGVIYTPTLDYTVSSNLITFTEIPPSGSNITVRALVAVTSGSINVLSGSFSGSFVGNISGIVTGTSSVAVSSSYASNADLFDGKDSTTFATTGSNIFNGNQTITGSLNVTQGITGSLFGTSSWANNAISSSYATTASFASNVLKTKAGSVTNTSFGGSPLTASVIFSTAFGNTNYAIAVTGEDSRAWIIQNKTTSGFEINSVSSVAITGTTYWTCTAYGEN